MPTLPSAPDNTAALPPDDNAVVRSLRSDPPRTPLELGRAVLYMSRIQRWTEAGRYLDLLMKADPDETTTSRIVRSTGLELWLQLENRVDDLSAEQRTFARRFIDASSSFARSEATLAGAISNLSAPELINRKRGVLALQSAGDAGLSAILQSIAESDKAPVPIASELIATMSPGGEESVQAALTISDLKAKQRLLQLAARVPGGGLMTELIAASHWPAIDDTTRDLVRKAVSPAGQAVPSLVATRRLLAEGIRGQLNEYLTLRNKPKLDIEAVWRWSADEKSLTAEADDLRNKRLERAFQLASQLLDLPVTPGQDDALAIAVVLERGYRLNPVFESETASRLNFGAIADRLTSAADFAWKEQLYGAQLRILQALPVLMKQPQDFPLEVWHERIEQYLESSAPAVRYQAALSMKLLNTSFDAVGVRPPFQRTQAEMRKLDAKSLAMVIGGGSERRDALSKQLSEMGIRSLHAGSAREALRLIQESEPIEMVFVVDRVLEMRLSELIQRLRNYPKVSRLPMAVLVDSRSDFADGLLATDDFSDITRGVLTVKAENTSFIVNEMISRSPFPRLDTIDRVLLRAAFETSLVPDGSNFSR